MAPSRLKKWLEAERIQTDATSAFNAFSLLSIKLVVGFSAVSNTRVISCATHPHQEFRTTCATHPRQEFRTPYTSNPRQAFRTTCATHPRQEFRTACATHPRQEVRTTRAIHLRQEFWTTYDDTCNPSAPIIQDVMCIILHTSQFNPITASAKNYVQPTRAKNSERHVQPTRRSQDDTCNPPAPRIQDDI